MRSRKLCTGNPGDNPKRIAIRPGAFPGGSLFGLFTSYPQSQIVRKSLIIERLTYNLR
jgi:hypothetical protein